jgi:AmmeMemoRadiSam system protein A
MDFDIPSKEQKTLLLLARVAIRDAILNDSSLQAALSGIVLTPPLLLKAGLFVTLKESGQGGRLRGCIGTMSSAEPLYKNVISTAPKAAMEDPRFSPLGEQELQSVSLSLSVLTPLQPIDDPEQIAVGRDGVQLERGAHRAVFLPNVALEQGWNRRQLLERLAIKAGLPEDGWREAMLCTFRAQQFGE